MDALPETLLGALTDMQTKILMETLTEIIALAEASNKGFTESGLPEYCDSVNTSLQPYLSNAVAVLLLIH
jgi:hypothetical protein